MFKNIYLVVCMQLEVFHTCPDAQRFVFQSQISLDAQFNSLKQVKTDTKMIPYCTEVS